MAKLIARYPGHCTVCGEFFHSGTEIDYERGAGARHVGCKPYVAGADDIYLAVGEGYGGEPYEKGTVILTDYRPSPDQPPTRGHLYVLHASRQYYARDGMSFGVGDERGSVYQAWCRPATAEEIAAAAAARERGEV